MLFLSRNSPVMRPFYDWQAMGTASCRAGLSRGVPAILAMVRRHEGEASERIAAYWLEHHPHGCFAFRSAAGQLSGFLLQLTLDTADPEEGAIDPAVDVAWRFVRRAGPPRPGERLWHLRFWMSSDGYQDLTAVTLAGGARRHTLADHTRVGLDVPGHCRSRLLVTDVQRDRVPTRAPMPTSTSAAGTMASSPMTGAWSRRSSGSSARV